MTKWPRISLLFYLIDYEFNALGKNGRKNVSNLMLFVAIRRKSKIKIGGLVNAYDVF